ncbi:hypothetical protein C8J56DRAFT_897303 [Mycena floridula]|nr:hypothetical protein C8J56DRAFT_897303 [Mycena floridula]
MFSLKVQILTEKGRDRPGEDERNEEMVFVLDCDGPPEGWYPKSSRGSTMWIRLCQSVWFQNFVNGWSSMSIDSHENLYVMTGRVASGDHTIAPTDFGVLKNVEYMERISTGGLNKEAPVLNSGLGVLLWPLMGPMLFKCYSLRKMVSYG